MKRIPWWLLYSLLLGTALASMLVAAQDFRPPKAQKVDPAKVKLISDKTRALGAQLSSLERQGLGDPWLAEVEVYYQAGMLALEHQEFYQPAYADWTLDALDRGLLRARLAASGEFPWLNVRGHTVVRGYRSHIDGTVQPFAVTLPPDYGKSPKKKWRIDVVLHGRDATLTEAKFLHRHAGDKPAPVRDYVQIDIYGRGNNAYRWAGEVDVFEALQAFIAMEQRLGRGNLLDPQRVVLRGFSMGGAGTWHIGLHMPDKWCVLGPGAGFTTTHGYVGKLPEKLPPHQEACLHIYDAADYAENVFNVPVVAYAGSDDAQIQAARNVEARLKPFDFAGKLKLLVAPGLGHSFPPEWQQKAEKEYAAHVARGREQYPRRVRFVTYTMKYASCDWVEILALDRHYVKALVDAEYTGEGFQVKTANVHSLHLTLPGDAPPKVTIHIDDQVLSTKPVASGDYVFHVYLRRTGTTWKAVLPQLLITERLRNARKVTGLQGPIDDAFTDAFLCVRGTGKPWQDAVQKHAEASLERFRREWSKFFRGEIAVKDDIDVTEQDIAGKNLILFGDPGSNSILAQALEALPLRWDKDVITFAGKSYPSKNHVPVLIHPSPLNPRKYLVLNTGHTFHEKDFLGTNALLYPRLGDYAILQLTAADDSLAVEPVMAGLFDENWKIAPSGSANTSP